MRICQNGSGRAVQILIKDDPSTKNQVYDQIQSQLKLNRPVRDLCSWNGRKILTMKNLIELNEPAWATVGGEGFLAQGPLEWFRDRKGQLDKEITETLSALAVIDQNPERGFNRRNIAMK